MQCIAVLDVVRAEWLVGLEHFALVDEPLSSDGDALCVHYALLQVCDENVGGDTQRELLLVVLQNLEVQSDVSGRHGEVATLSRADRPHTHETKGWRESDGVMPPLDEQ